jgi:DNA-binding transcriptional LysR family regulator
MSVPDLEAWAMFVTVAEHGGLAPAARELGVSVPTVSRAVARLEARLGAVLFHRTSRRLALSAAGSAALPEAQQVIAAAQALEERAVDAAAASAGTIRLAAPMDFGRAHLAPALPDFLAQWPKVSIDLNLDDARIDIVAGGHDLVLRIANLADSSLIARQLCSVRRLLVAAPVYVARHGAPAHPAELARHRALTYANVANPYQWRFAGAERQEWTVTVAGPLHANSGGALLPALLAGEGVAVLPEFLLAGALAQGRVETLLPDWSVAPLALNMVTPPGRRRPARVRLLMDWLVERFSTPPWEG